MKHTLFSLFLISLVLSIQSCQGDSAASESAEAVVRKYQSFLDNNQFEEAKKISTPLEAENLDFLARILAMTPNDSTILHTNILSIKCVEERDSAFCECLMKDEEEEYESFFTLIKIDGEWRVDSPEEEDVEIDMEEVEEEWGDEE